MPAASIDRKFSGTPRRYRTLALVMGVGSHVYLYAGMFVIEYCWHQRAWILGWRPMLAAAVSALAFSALCIRTFRVLDSVRGSSRRRQLAALRAKLPELR